MPSKEEIEKIKRGLTEELGRTITANECGLSTNDFSESIEILEGALKYIEQLESREQKLIEKLEDKIMIVKKLLDEILVDMGNGIKAINITGLTRKEKEEVTNKRNCLMVQKYCYEEILKILKGENDEC